MFKREPDLALFLVHNKMPTFHCWFVKWDIRLYVLSIDLEVLEVLYLPKWDWVRPSENPNAFWVVEVPYCDDLEDFLRYKVGSFINEEILKEGFIKVVRNL